MLVYNYFNDEVIIMKKLNIFVDETGDFGYGKKASSLYGVSLTFHEQEDDIEIN